MMTTTGLDECVLNHIIVYVILELLFFILTSNKSTISFFPFYYLLVYDCLVLFAFWVFVFFGFLFFFFSFDLTFPSVGRSG